ATRSIEYAQQRAGALIGEISGKQQSAVQDIIARGIDRGHTDQTVARSISRVVGLDSRGAGAVDNHRQQIITAGGSVAAADRSADDYAKRLAWSRAQTIANT